MVGRAAEWVCGRQFFWGAVPQGRAAEWVCERQFFSGAVPQGRAAECLPVGVYLYILNKTYKS